MKELKFEELTTRQKLGMCFTAFLNSWEKSEDNEEFIFEMIKERALGSVWVQQGFRDAEALIKKVKEIADYPIIIMTDAESGITVGGKSYLVGRHSAISNTGDEKYAYAFGKVLGTIAHKTGYNMVCNPLLDIRGGHVRSLGGDKEQVAKFASAIARGMHDGGVLTVGKHYPGADNPKGIDSHMAESVSYQTKEELRNDGLYPYVKLIEQGLLDGIMTGHKKMVNIDPERPASLSKPVIDIIREQGFDGFAITDALVMMGIRAKYNDIEAKGYAIAAGNDSVLPFTNDSREKFDCMVKAYEQGLIPDEMLDAAVKRVLNTQHKTLSLVDDAEISDEEMHLFENTDRDGVFAKTDDGVSTSISRDGNHYFAVMVRNELVVDANGKVDVDTFSSKWYYPLEVEAQLKKLFPNSTVEFIHEFPSQSQNIKVLNNSVGSDELVFITITEPLCYTGKERFTHRFVGLLEAMQYTDRVSTVIHFGNPRILSDLPHVPRLIVGGLSKKSVEASIDVLAGEHEAKGALSCKVDLK